MKVVAATHNKGKIREFNEILGKLGFSVVPQSELGIDIEPEENGATFEENALIKARTVSEYCDFCVIADDSGLCVDALLGAPGIYSARYAGENATDDERNAKLLGELDGVLDRSAKFVSAIAFILPDGEEIVTLGETEGEILKIADGNGGFGYDPIFYSMELGKSFGAASPDEKNMVSHRARALFKLYDILKER